MEPTDEISIFWFRRDLRTEDNHGLFKALTGKYPVLPVFIFDTQILDDLEDRSDSRVSFIYDVLSAMNHNLKRYHSGIKIFKGEPLEIFIRLTEKYTIREVYANSDFEPYGIERDTLIKKTLNERGIAFNTFKDHVIFGESDILKDDGTPYKVFTGYKNKWMFNFKEPMELSFPSASHMNHLVKKIDFEFPDLQHIGFTRGHLVIPAPEIDPEIILKYDQNRDFPYLNGTSRIGIHLRHGTISIRKSISIARKHSSTWLNELIWREFYMMILYHFPEVVDHSFKREYDQIRWINNEADFESWKTGNTGYPIVDAGMRELYTTGFMHNRLRMITASFLTKHLLIDWRWGEAYFAQKLLDFELASNNGGWQWAAGTGTDAQPYFRVFNPYLQTQKFDPNYVYINKWVPEYLTKDYPKPIIEHRFARERAINCYKSALR